jgi:signal transduction histidine kinase
MKNYNILLILLLLFLFAGCRSGEPQKDREPTLRIAKVIDSLRFIDSLIMATRFNHVNFTIDMARRALTIAREIGTDHALIKAYNIMGNALSLSMTDSAFFYYTKALNVKSSQQAYLEKPMLLYNIAMLYVAASNHKNAIVLLDSALQVSATFKDYIVSSNALNALGIVYSSIGNEITAKKMFDSAFCIAKLHKLPLQIAAALGNIAGLEKNPVVAMNYEREAIRFLENCKEGVEQMASIYINLGLKMTIPDSAIACYNVAIGLINRENAPQTLLTAYNNLVYSYLEKGEVRKAEQYLLSFAFPLAKQIKDDASMANLYDTYADVLSAEGRYREALSFEKKSMKLLDLADKQETDKQVRLLAAMLDLKNKEVIARTAQQESVQTKASYAAARFWFAIIILVVLFFTVALAFYLVRNIAVSRAKLIAAAKKIILVEENEKTNLGRELHDLTGHKLLNFTNFMESASFKSRDEQSAGMNILIDLQDHLRKLSHRLKRNWLDKFTMERNIEAMCRETIRYNQINLSYSQPEQYPELSDDMKVHLYRIVQELLTNASKYAKKAQIVLDISIDHDHLLLRYADDGEGFDREKFSDEGIGIINIYERIRLLNGEVVLDTRPGYGVSWEIAIPVNAKKSFLDKLSGGGA